MEIVGGRRRWSRPLTQRVIRPTLLHYYYYYYYYSFFFGSASLPLLYLQVGWKRRRSAARRRPRGDGSAEAASPAPVVPRPGRSGRSAPRPLRTVGHGRPRFIFRLMIRFITGHRTVEAIRDRRKAVAPIRSIINCEPW